MASPTAWARHLPCRSGERGGNDRALGVIAIATSQLYDALNHGPAVLFLRSPIDDATPVVGAFVVPYVSLRPLLYLSAVLWLLFRARIYRSAALSMTTVLVTSYASYVFLQSYIEPRRSPGTTSSRT